MGQRHWHELRAEGAQGVRRAIDSGADACVEVGGEVLSRQADTQSAQRARSRIDGQWLDGNGRRILIVGTADGCEHPRRVVHRPADHRDAIERRPESDQPVAAHSAIGRLDPDDAAEAGWLPNRTAGLGAKRGWHHASGHECRRAARGATRDAVRMRGVLDPTERGVFGGRAHREFVEVGLGGDHRAGLPQAAHDGGIVRRAIAGQDP